MNTFMRTLLGLGAGAIAGTGAGAATYVALELDNDVRAFHKGSEVLKREDKTEVLQDLEQINNTQRDSDTAARNVSIVVALASTALVATATAGLLPDDDSGLDQGGVELGYVAGRQHLDNRPNPNPFDPHTYQEVAFTRET